MIRLGFEEGWRNFEFPEQEMFRRSYLYDFMKVPGNVSTRNIHNREYFVMNYLSAIFIKKNYIPFACSANAANFCQRFGSGFTERVRGSVDH